MTKLAAKHIVRQAVRREPYTYQLSVCVSWWNDGTVTETDHIRKDNGFVWFGETRDLPSGTAWSEDKFFSLISTVPDAARTDSAGAAQVPEPPQESAT